MRVPAVWVFLTVVVLAGAVVPAVAADLSLQYNVDRRVFRVCNLLLPGATAYTNYTPFFFIALDHSALKPAGWEFDNPLASPRVTPAMAALWIDGAHSPVGGSGANYWTDRGMAVGSPINKSWPQHWEVTLNAANAPRLRDFDLIYVSAAAIELATAAERAVLMNIVRDGATLWIDSGATNYTTAVANFAPPLLTPLGSPFTFTSVASSNNFYRGVTDPNNLSDLFISPLRLTPGEVRLLGRYPDGATACDGSYVSVGGVLDQPLQPILSTWDSSASPATATTAIAVNEYGAGRIIVSACGIGMDVEDWFVAGARTPNRYQAPDVKFAYNALAWGTQWDAGRQASTNTGYTTTSALPPLDLVWQWPAPTGPANLLLGPILASPVISHGRLYAISLISMVPAGGAATPAMLLCFDAGASTAPGASPSYQLLWSAPLNALINTACGAALTDATPHWNGLSAVDMPNGVHAILFSATSRAGAGPGYVVAVNAATGAAMLGYTAAPYPGAAGENPAVRDISTPVVHNGWVYFLTSEINGATADDTYGRAHCIDLGTLGATAGWVYPDPNVASEARHLLPPFAEPSWVAAVAGWADPGGGPRQVPFDAPMIPIVTPHTRNANDNYTESVMTVGSPVSLAFDGTNILINRANLGAPFDPAGAATARRGGLDFALVPTPLPGLNASYYHLFLQNAIDWGQTVTVARADDNTLTALTAFADPDATNGLILPPADARRLLSTVSATGITDPLALPAGVRVRVTYQPVGATASTTETAFLPGIKPWSVQYADGERRCTNAAVRGDRLFATTNTPDAAGVPAGVSAHVVMQDLRDAARDARFSPIFATPPAFGGLQARSEAAPALGHGTAAAASVVLGPAVPNGGLVMPTLSALAADLNLRVSLGTYPRAAALPQAPVPYGISRGSATTIALLAGAGVVDESQYQVGLADASVTFNWDAAPNVIAGGGPSGPIYGQPVLVSWTSDNGTPDDPGDDAALGPELYVVPQLSRFDETSAWLTPAAAGGGSDIHGAIKLQHYPVELSTVRITTADGVRVAWPAATGTTAAEPTVAFSDPTTTPATAYPSLAPHGWIDLTTARLDLNANGVADATEPGIPVGITLLVSYRGFNNDFGFFNVGAPLGGYANPGWAPAYPPERVQAPILFGGSASAVTMAGSAIHVGTEGYAYRDTSSPADTFSDFENPGGDVNDTFLSFQWDPASNFVRAFTCPVADRGIFGTPGSVVTATGMPAPTANGLFTGGRVMSNASLGLEIGFLSKLRTRETIIVDAGRVLRCVGQDPASELTGTQSFERGQSALDARPTPLPFNHPSKVSVLQNGNLLVVDTGNNRVVETDAAGNVVWPLDPAGFNYYSSAANSNLHLLRPTDAERYYNTYDIDGNGTMDEVTNTVIADGGNSRVIHVRSYWSWNGPTGAWVQHHQVQVITPEFLRDPANPARRVRAHYTQVELITNPQSGVLAGYLLAAPNLNQLIVRAIVGPILVTNPPDMVPMAGAGAYNWGLWSWLYNPPGSSTADPLSFLGIRNIALRRVGDTVYLDVSALQYQGRYQAFAGNGVPFYQTIGAATDPGAGVFEWQVNYATPGTGLIHATPGGADNYACPIWRFTQVEYAAVPYFNIALPAGGTFTKRFVPTSAQILPSGRHLVSNFTGVVERFSKAALGLTGVVTSSEVFEVTTNTSGDTNPANDAFTVDYRRLMPDPYGPDWPDPLIAPVYAERVMY